MKVIAKIKSIGLGLERWSANCPLCDKKAQKEVHIVANVEALHMECSCKTKEREEVERDEFHRPKKKAKPKKIKVNSTFIAYRCEE